MKRNLSLALACAAALAACGAPSVGWSAGPEPVIVYRGNPIIRDRFTADPAPLVVGDTLYLYTGHDQAADGVMFDMRDWLVFSTRDMIRQPARKCSTCVNGWSFRPRT